MVRNNEYYLARLRKDGRRDLLDEIKAGTITVYQASIRARYRKKRLKPSAAKLKHTWDRTGINEKRRFVLAHYQEISAHLKYLSERIEEMQKESQKDDSCWQIDSRMINSPTTNDS